MSALSETNKNRNNRRQFECKTFNGGDKIRVLIVSLESVPVKEYVMIKAFLLMTAFIILLGFSAARADQHTALTPAPFQSGIANF
jgi:hypothetical protein